MKLQKEYERQKELWETAGRALQFARNAVVQGEALKAKLEADMSATADKITKARLFKDTWITEHTT